MDPDLLLLLIRRLPDTSMTSAMQADQDHWDYYLGWGEQRYMLKALHDLLGINVRASGNWKKGKAPDFPAWDSPKQRIAAAEKKKKPVSVLDIVSALAGKPGVGRL